MATIVPSKRSSDLTKYVNQWSPFKMLHHTPDFHTAMMAQILPPTQLYIDGAWTVAATGETFDAYDPRTGAVVTKVHQAGVCVCGYLIYSIGRSNKPLRIDIDTVIYPYRHHWASRRMD